MWAKEEGELGNWETGSIFFSKKTNLIGKWNHGQIYLNTQVHEPYKTGAVSEKTGEHRLNMPRIPDR